MNLGGPSGRETTPIRAAASLVAVAASLLAATYAVRPIVRRFVEAMFHGRLPCAWLNTLLEHHEAGALDHYYGRAERGFRSLSGGKGRADRRLSHDLEQSSGSPARWSASARAPGGSTALR